MQSEKSNLDFFLRCTTPVVQSQLLPNTEIRKLNRLWHPWEREAVEYFTLADLWNSFDEWSAYGAGVPITLPNGETLAQYYVPYLSAIQIFTSNTFRKEAESGAARQETHTTIRTARRVRAISFGGGMEPHQKREDLNMIIASRI